MQITLNVKMMFNWLWFTNLCNEILCGKKTQNIGCVINERGVVKLGLLTLYTQIEHNNRNNNVDSFSMIYL